MASNLDFSLFTLHLIYLLYLLNDGLECLGIVYSEVSKCLAVEVDTSLMEGANELRVGHTLGTGCCVDTLNPQSTELALLATTVGECVGETFLIGVFGNGPNVLASTELTFDALQNLLAASA